MSSTEAPKIMVFRPTLEEMKDFSGYIAYMESKGAHKAGVAKVIPPKEFIPRKDYSTVDLTIPAPIQQEVMGHKGLFTQFNIQKKALTFHEYKKLAQSDKYKTPAHFDYEDLERKYWRNLAYNSPIYGADVSGSISDTDWNIWNINKLGTVLDVIEEEQGVKIEGVNTAYLYFGMWKTTFAWHTEDMDLYSINYIHFGAPKTWYAIPPSHAKRLERLAAGFYPQNFQVCSNFLRHKMTVISPHILKKYSIPVNKITQESGEFMITFPYGYHSGFNHGFNCAESTNFASDRWIDYGKRARCCTCARDSVKINMDPFVRIFQPDRYEDWVMGKDFIHIEDIDGPMSDAQLEAKKEKKPSKKESALLKRKMAEIPNKPRRHPVHKRGELGEEVESPNKVKKKRGRMASMAFSSISEALASSSATSDDDMLEIEVEIKEQMPPVNVKQELQKKIKEKSKKKPIKTETELGKADKVAKSPVKSPRYTPSKVQQDSKPVKVKTKRALEEEMMKAHDEQAKKLSKSEQMKERDDRKPIKMEIKAVKQEPKVSSEEVITEHAYSSHPSTTGAPSTSTSLEPVKTEKMHKDKKKSKHHHHHHHHSSSSSKHSSKHHKSSSSSKEKEKVKKRERRGRGKHMKDFTPQEYATMKNWARSMFGLWVTQPNSFEMEQAYNASMADQKPGCCVCSLFYNDKVDMMWSSRDGEQGKIDSHDWGTGDRAFSSSMNKVAGTQRDRRMVVLAPEYCFAASSENPNPNCANSLLSADGRSPILTCSQCMIAVHASCYGEANPPENGEWKCDRCQEGDFIAECCLCNLRGGALKLTNKDTWAHIVCAMAIPDVMFEDVEAREPININRISPARIKLKCFFCRTFIKNSPNNGACIQCSVGKCALSFHVTCAHAAGVIMEASDWPFSVYATCLRHPFPNRDMPRERPLRELKMKERVIAKYKNNRYYKSAIVGDRNQLFYHVLFDDGTFSDNLFAQDIESHDCMNGVDPEKGEAVSVRWTDNELYNGKFVKSYYVKLYDVMFENESKITVKREDIYAMEEPLPKRVKTRFSQASDMQHEGFLENKVVPEKIRHLPNRGEGDDHPGELSPTESHKPSTSNTFLSFGELHKYSTTDGEESKYVISGRSREESKFGISSPSHVDSDSLVTLFKPEPPSISDSPFKVKSEPDLSVGAAIMNPENSSFNNSTLRVKAESPDKRLASPTSVSSLSPTTSYGDASHGQYTGMSGGGDAHIKLSPSKRNTTSGSQLNVPMTTSEAAEALAALTSMSSFPSSQRHLLPR